MPITEGESKFVVYNFAGKPRAYYQVSRHVPEAEHKEGGAARRVVSHHIIVVDRSGSMYYEIEPLKETLVRVLSIDEYQNSDLKVTLLSYSSSGDLSCHFQRIPVQEVMAPRSPYLEEIRKIQVTGLTCISQGLRLAGSLVDDEELTAITLHSDGYANDRSSQAEAKALDEICESLKKRNVFVNTIAYSGSADFRLLSRVAGTVSGTCVQVDQMKLVYESLYDTSKRLSEMAGPIYTSAIDGADYQVSLSRSARRINGSTTDLKLVGLSEEDDRLVYRYTRLEADAYKALDVPEVQSDLAVFAFARAQLADGNVGTAKYALLSTLDTSLSHHLRALTGSQVAAMSRDLEAVLFDPTVLEGHTFAPSLATPGGVSLLEVIGILSDHKQDLKIDLGALNAVYVRRGVRRVPGTRDDQGNLVKPWLKTRYRGEEGGYVQVGSFDINRNSATINVLLTQPVELVTNDEAETPIKEVAGIGLDQLTAFNNYTLLGDGELNVRQLVIKIGSQALFDALQEHKLLLDDDGHPVATWEPAAAYLLPLDGLPIVPFDIHFESLDGVFETLAQLKTLTSILDAHITDESEVFTPEQVAELKRHYLSKSLYINFPTTTEYTDLQEAIANGSIDSRTSYKIDIGSPEILNLGKLMSANKLLDRFYEAFERSSGKKLDDKPTFEMAMATNDVGFREKKLSARTKITPVDRFQKAILDEFLGSKFDITTTTGRLLSAAGAQDFVDLAKRRAGGEAVDAQQWVAAIGAARRKLEAHTDRLFRERLSPLVLYIGSTGVLPDEFDVRAQGAEDIAARYEELKISEAESGGLFFEISPKLLLTVYAKNEHFSTGTRAR